MENRQPQEDRDRGALIEGGFEIERGQIAILGQADEGAIAQTGAETMDDKAVVGQGVAIQIDAPQSPVMMQIPVRASGQFVVGMPLIGLEVMRTKEHAFVPVDRPGRHGVFSWDA
jgi:hypothetical protein